MYSDSLAAFDGVNNSSSVVDAVAVVFLQACHAIRP